MSQYPMWDPRGYCGIPWLPTASRVDLAGCRGTPRDPTWDLEGARGVPWKFTRKLPREPSVGIHEILLNARALGLGSEYGLGVSRELGGSHGNSEKLGGPRGRSWELVGSTMRDRSGSIAGSYGNSWEQNKTTRKGLHRNPRKPVHPRGNPRIPKRSCGITSDNA